MIKDAYRLMQSVLFISSLLVLAASFYFQYVKGLQPCPLCIMQRLCVFLTLIFSFLALFLKSPGARRFFVMMQLLVALGGIYFACRQLWLQSLPADQLPACLPGLDVLLRYFPWRDVLHALIWGAADCGEITWQWLGISMPGWSGLYFGGVFLGAIFCAYFLHRLTRPLSQN
jgi:protein dithiol:quinone oxidoreductase